MKGVRRSSSSCLRPTHLSWSQETILFGLQLSEALGQTLAMNYFNMHPAKVLGKVHCTHRVLQKQDSRTPPKMTLDSPLEALKSLTLSSGSQSRDGISQDLWLPSIASTGSFCSCFFQLPCWGRELLGLMSLDGTLIINLAILKGWGEQMTSWNLQASGWN